MGPSAGPSSTYAWRRPSSSTYWGAYDQSGSESKQESGVLTNSTPSVVVMITGSESHAGEPLSAAEPSVSTSAVPPSPVPASLVPPSFVPGLGVLASLSSSPQPDSATQVNRIDRKVTCLMLATPGRVKVFG